MASRIESDSFGKIKVPSDKYWGAGTQRSLQFFKIGKGNVPIELIHAIAIVKKAAAFGFDPKPSFLSLNPPSLFGLSPKLELLFLS